MSKLEDIELQVSRLPPQELARFRAWYSDFDADAWDRHLDQDIAAGKLDKLAENALQTHAAGITKPL